MRKVILSMQMSLDGYIAAPDDAMDWIYNGSDEWEDTMKELNEVDTFLLGAKMYPGYAEYWKNALTDPNAMPEEKAYARLAERTQHVVFSKSMERADWNNTTIARDIDSEMARLKQEPGKNMILWGGARMAQAFIAKELIDEYRLIIVPVMLGDGKRLFEQKVKRHKLELVSSKQLSGGAVIMRYRTVR